MPALERQLDCERRTISDLALHIDAAMMAVNDLLSDRKTDARALFFRRKERVENLAENLFRHTLPSVFHPDPSVWGEVNLTTQIFL